MLKIDEAPANAGSARARAPVSARVLIVDDDPAMRTLCAVNLALEGLVVLEATGGRSGLERARAELPDLVLTDVSMPRFDGFQLAAALRRGKHTREIPLIFLSGETSTANKDRAEKLGALAYLTKPFDPPMLASTVVDALARIGKLERSAVADRGDD